MENKSHWKFEVSQKEEDPEVEKLILSTFGMAAEILVERGIVPKEKEVELSVAVVDRDEIQNHNKEYRKKDEPTDVLSFCYENDSKHVSGELILCLEVIKENAAEDKIPWEEEFRKNIFHGLLHVLGYEHGDEMFSLQESMMKR